MTNLPQVSHERVIRVLKKAGFSILRKGKHISMTDGKNIVIIPRHHFVPFCNPSSNKVGGSTPER